MPLSSHASRWLVAAIAAPIILWVLFLAPPEALYILILLFGLGAWWEYLTAAFGPGRWGLKTIGLAGWTLTATGAFFFGPFGQMAGLFLAMVMVGLYFTLAFSKVTDLFDQTGRLALGHAYISLCFSCLLVLFSVDYGPKWVLVTLLVTFLGDAAAFYTGRSIGKHLLYPAVSPKKTWEGLAGGVLGSGLSAAVLSAFFLPVPWSEAGLLGLIMGLAAAAGDLFESALKRSAGIKDSGSILLGHGGVWDRIDALLFNAPLVLVFVFFYNQGF
ncbi:MAG: phosphatidate cytidylyltransferase [Deltaproteobacteria bacterium]|nr:phosphatidate cytidylyltransferase [Deltaproteobacteria bacterium]